MHRCMALNCQFKAISPEEQKKKGNSTTCMPITPKIYDPFTCYEYIQKKITVLNDLKKCTTLTCQIISPFFFFFDEVNEQWNSLKTYRP